MVAVQRCTRVFVGVKVASLMLSVVAWSWWPAQASALVTFSVQLTVNFGLAAGSFGFSCRQLVLLVVVSLVVCAVGVTLGSGAAVGLMNEAQLLDGLMYVVFA